MTFSAFDMTQPHNVIHGDNDVEVLHAAIWSSDITISLFSLVYCKKVLKKSHQPSTKYCQLKLEIHFLVRLFWGLEYSDFIQYRNKVMFFLCSIIKKREYFMLFSFIIIFLPSSILIILFFSISWRNSLLFKRISMLKKNLGVPHFLVR